ncbi:MAG: hypothetical protein OXG74_14840 [Acidobacteria bacterium]|nr:hypothetical protein [Acidobacteriota bacterium]
MSLSTPAAVSIAPVPPTDLVLSSMRTLTCDQLVESTLSMQDELDELMDLQQAARWSARDTNNYEHRIARAKGYVAALNAEAGRRCVAS